MFYYTIAVTFSAINRYCNEEIINNNFIKIGKCVILINNSQTQITLYDSRRKINNPWNNSVYITVGGR